MSSGKRRWMPITAVTVITAGSQLIPATARADLHNVTYIARIDGVTTGSQAAFVTAGGQTNTAGLSPMPGNVFEADTVLADPQQAGMQILLRWPYSANVHCEIDVDGISAVKVDRFINTWAKSNDPLSGVLQCGAPLSGMA